jgi:hypothetical protein
MELSKRERHLRFPSLPYGGRSGIKQGMTLKLAAAKGLSSNSLENYRGPAGDRVLIQIKMRGPQTAAQIGERLGTTGENARQLLKRWPAVSDGPSRFGA